MFIVCVSVQMQKQQFDGTMRNVTGSWPAAFRSQQTPEGTECVDLPSRLDRTGQCFLSSFSLSRRHRDRLGKIAKATSAANDRLRPYVIRSARSSRCTETSVG